MVTLNEKLEIVVGNALALASLDDLHEKLGVKDVPATRKNLKQTLIVTSTMLIGEQFELASIDEKEEKLAEMILSAVKTSQSMVRDGVNIGDIMRGVEDDSPESNS